MHNFSHILSKNGVLVAFNIAKRVNQEEVKKIRDKIEETCDDPDEINKRLEQMIVLHMKNTIGTDQIPGLIFDGNKTKSDPFNHIPIKLKQKLINMAMVFNGAIAQEKLNKELILILLQLILMHNKINNDDIIDFNKKYKFMSDDDDDYLDEEDDDENDDDDKL